MTLLKEKIILPMECRRLPERGGNRLTGSDMRRVNPYPGRCWRARFAGLLLALSAGGALAQGAVYKVEIDAPEELTTLLRENLDLVRWSTRDDVSEDQLRQLEKTAPEQARELLATEGYFSAQVRAVLERRDPEWLVRMYVVPGEPTRVGAIDFTVSGAIESDPQREARVAAARKAFAMKQGEIFRQSDWDDGKQRAVGPL